MTIDGREVPMNEWPPTAFGPHFPPPPDWKWADSSRGFTIPKGYGPAWEKSLWDAMIEARHQAGIPSGGSQRPEDQEPSEV